MPHWNYLSIFAHINLQTIKIIILMQKEYISPEVEILDVVSEGVLCASNELLEETEGEW